MMMRLAQLYMAGNWDLGNFLKNATTTLKGWGNLLIILLGVVMIIVGVVKLVKGLISQGRGQTNWVVVILLLVVGGALMVGGFTWVSGIAQGGKKTIDDLGSGSGGMIIPCLDYIKVMYLPFVG